MPAKIINLIFDFPVPSIAGVIVVFIWGNLSPEHYHAFVDTPFAGMHTFGQLNLRFDTNEVFMVLFPGLATVKITPAYLSSGDLNTPGKLINPLLAILWGITVLTVLFAIVAGRVLRIAKFP